MAVDTINLNEEQKRMAEANDKARKDKEQALLLAQAKKMQSLLSEMGYNEDSIKAFMDRNEVNSAWNANNKDLKPKPEDTPESLEYYGQPADSSFNHINPIYKDAGKAGYAYNKDRGPTANGPTPPGYKGKLSTPPHYYNVDIGENPVEKTFASNYPYRNDLDKKPEEVPADNTKAEPENLYLKYAIPEVNAALKAIADRDPEAMMLPEVRALLRRSEDGFKTQVGLAALAPWTNSPENTLALAKDIREQGDKNLMDAAGNLETIRTRQLDATKAMADDLTRQKGNLVSLGNAVLNMQGQGLMSLPAVYEGAREAMTEANRVHETGDARINAAGASLRSFLSSSIDAMLQPDKKKDTKYKATVDSIIKDINDTIQTEGMSEAAWYDRIDPKTKEKKVGLITKLNELKPYLNQNSQADLTKRIDAMNDDLAAYKAAMATEKQHRATAFNAEMRGNQVFNTLANVGKSFKMPLTEINPISPEVGELEAAYGKSNKSDYNNNANNSNSYNSGNEAFEIHGDNKIIKTPKGKDEDIIDSKSDGSKKMYSKYTKLLDDYVNIPATASAIEAKYKETSTTEAAKQRADEWASSQRAKITKEIYDLSSGGSKAKAKVFYRLLTNPYYRKVIDQIMPDSDASNANRKIFFINNGQKNGYNEELSSLGSKAIQDQNDIIQRYMLNTIYA